jgi:hypothetical protein
MQAQKPEPLKSLGSGSSFTYQVLKMGYYITWWMILQVCSRILGMVFSYLSDSVTGFLPCNMVWGDSSRRLQNRVFSRLDYDKTM